MTQKPNLDPAQLQTLHNLVAARIQQLRQMGTADDPAIERDTDRYIRELCLIRSTLIAISGKR